MCCDEGLKIYEEFVDPWREVTEAKDARPDAARTLQDIDAREEAAGLEHSGSPLV